jgi:hypothetical protein
VTSKTESSNKAEASNAVGSTRKGGNDKGHMVRSFYLGLRIRTLTSVCGAQIVLRTKIYRK